MGGVSSGRGDDRASGLWNIKNCYDSNMLREPQRHRA